MRTLVIDSATEACSVALFEHGSLVAGTCEVLGRGHAERLIPMIAALPDRGRAAHIAVSLGPGSFTGIRVGIAAARALALAWNAVAFGFETFALLAAMARADTGADAVAIAMTGGHGEWFVAGYGRGDAPARPLASLRPADAAAATAETVVAGSQAEALVALRGRGTALTLLPDARRFDLLGAGATTASLAPIYGRPPDARPQAAR